MKRFIHTSGITGRIGFELRPGGKAEIFIERLGEREVAICSGPAVDFARKCYDERDIDGYVALWQANAGETRQEAA